MLEPNKPFRRWFHEHSFGGTCWTGTGVVEGLGIIASGSGPDVVASLRIRTNLGSWMTCLKCKYFTNLTLLKLFSFPRFVFFFQVPAAFWGCSPFRGILFSRRHSFVSLLPRMLFFQCGLVEQGFYSPFKYSITLDLRVKTGSLHPYIIDMINIH